MRLPNRHKLGTLTALAALLAWMSTGSLTICELMFGVDPVTGPTINVTLPAGENASNITLLGAIFSRFALCNLATERATSSAIPAGTLTTVPTGVYTRCNRDLRGEPSATVDLITSASTPPGHYLLEYRDASPGSYVIGTLDLTVEPGQSDVTACMAVFGEGEVIVVNQTVTYYACCSSGPPGDPVVEYKWWFNYNGNPSSAPSRTVTQCETTSSYTTPGTKNVRVVVKTQSGLTAEDTQAIVVQAP